MADSSACSSSNSFAGQAHRRSRSRSPTRRVRSMVMPPARSIGGGLARRRALQQRRGAHRDFARARRADHEVLERRPRSRGGSPRSASVSTSSSAASRAVSGSSRRSRRTATPPSLARSMTTDVGMGFLDRLERVAAALRFEDVEPVRRQALAELAPELLIGLDQYHLPAVATRVHGYAVTSRLASAVPTTRMRYGAASVTRVIALLQGCTNP